jgi:hypothetical protein
LRAAAPMPGIMMPMLPSGQPRARGAADRVAAVLLTNASEVHLNKSPDPDFDGRGRVGVVSGGRGFRDRLRRRSPAGGDRGGKQRGRK